MEKKGSLISDLQRDLDQVRIELAQVKEERSTFQTLACEKDTRISNLKSDNEAFKLKERGDWDHFECLWSDFFYYLIGINFNGHLFDTGALAFTLLSVQINSDKEVKLNTYHGCLRTFILMSVQNYVRLRNVRLNNVRFKVQGIVGY